MLTSPGLRRSTVVTAVSRRGLDLEVDGSARFVVWSSIGSVIAGMIGASSGGLFVLALEFEVDRMVIVAESERTWGDLTAILHIALPEIEPFSAWGARLAIAPDVLTLYERSAAAVAPT
jgi:hypothetical protein